MSSEFVPSTVENTPSSQSQRHGQDFEQLILNTKGLSAAKGRSPTFDAPYGAFEEGSALSIKLSGKDDIELADAQRAWSWGAILRNAARVQQSTAHLLFIVGRYEQHGDEKRVVCITELCLDYADPKVGELLYGTVHTGLVAETNLAIQEEHLPDIDVARQVCVEMLAEFEPRLGAVKLRRKINSDQRRVQCAVSLDKLKEAAVDWHDYTGLYRTLQLPLVLQSGKRQRRSVEQKVAEKVAQAEKAAGDAQAALARLAGRSEQPSVDVAGMAAKVAAAWHATAVAAAEASAPAAQPDLCDPLRAQFGDGAALA